MSHAERLVHPSANTAHPRRRLAATNAEPLAGSRTEFTDECTAGAPPSVRSLGCPSAVSEAAAHLAARLAPGVTLRGGCRRLALEFYASTVKAMTSPGHAGQSGSTIGPRPGESCRRIRLGSLDAESRVGAVLVVDVPDAFVFLGTVLQRVRVEDGPLHRIIAQLRDPGSRRCARERGTDNEDEVVRTAPPRCLPWTALHGSTALVLRRHRHRGRDQERSQGCCQDRRDEPYPRSHRYRCLECCPASRKSNLVIRRGCYPSSVVAAIARSTAPKKRKFGREPLRTAPASASRPRARQIVSCLWAARVKLALAGVVVRVPYQDVGR